ncbi:MAG: response regulator [Candidatus Pacebacteria bacterium]|jgi:DNA-binding response OmpR family regulator|nr:response regulator [Candidatus Paceibacterota bacterium]
MDENKKKVMIVEDDEHISRVYEIKLAKEGIVSSLARDGEEAVTKIIAEKPNLILLDLMIPKKDGFVVLEEIKKNPEVAGIPVVVLSNLGQQSDQDRALALGAKEYLVKVNTSIQEVVDKVKGYLA